MTDRDLKLISDFFYIAFIFALVALAASQYFNNRRF